MVTYKRLPGVLIGFLVVGGIWWVAHLVQQRMVHCAPVPLLAENLLPNADLALPGSSPTVPLGWSAGAPGANLGTFALDGDMRSFHLMGIANSVETPAIAVQAGQTICFGGYAITDSVKGSATRVQVVFLWQDEQGHELARDRSPWQDVVLWRQEAPPESWSRIGAAFVAPAGATHLRVQIHPASDDRVYLDVMHAQVGGVPLPSQPPTTSQQPMLTVALWPGGNHAAVSFSFDWETAMAGLVHSRSVGDPYADQDPIVRGLRMREGITTTLALFEPCGIRATYYAAGYTLLVSNTARVQFMGNPTYAWANTDNRWTTNHWTSTPWFASDPYGTAQSDPAWYAGDLVPAVLHHGHDIQSHTFTHFYGGFVGAHEWQEDFKTWAWAASAQGMPPVRSLAFPWSSSGGMSYADWDEVEAAGITSVTRLSDQSQYALFPQDAQGIVTTPRCIPLPGHERILACPDFYLTPASADRAIEQINRAREMDGMIDLWAHTEEVISTQQRAAWKRVVDYTCSQPDVWVAPLREIAGWQQALAQVHIQPQPTDAPETGADMPHTFLVTNNSSETMEALTLRVAPATRRVTVDGREETMDSSGQIVTTLLPHQSLEVNIWPG